MVIKVRSKVDGRLISPGTWEYKPAMALDIPIKVSYYVGCKIYYFFTNRTM